ncbi:MAG: hypothetical protein VYE54_06450, partial [Pseudomonadota bacterium]|nr:hypothetical protein [Pseudomonadota bacterium]
MATQNTKSVTARRTTGTAKTPRRSKADQQQVQELARWRTAVGGAMTAIMMVDRDLVVTYVNE